MADIITYPEDGIRYDADDASGYLATRLSGVYSAEEDFSVTAQGGLSVQVSAGQAWVHPARFKGRSIIMEQPTTVVLTEADPVRSRIDRIVLRYDAAAKKTSLQVLDGTPDSAAPAAPEISRTELVYDLCLAEIRRPAGSTSITAADITDTRADETVCGVMRDGVTGIPTGTLVQQFRAVIDALKGEAADKLGYYPVGSIYQSTDPTSPAALFGGSWEEIASERVLMGASSTHAAGTTVKAGLPNLKGSSSGVASTAYPNVSNSGALSINTNNGGLAGYEGGSYGSNCTVSFDASKSNAIYGRSSTVQPAAYYVHIWHRVA
ncbi:phage baseplate protein [Faecalibacterium sp. 9]|uniref:phage baseplate protein n=1 Tax=Faecalibacterium sp. 9 TaxID=3402018 RepID=UPI003AAD39C4